MSGHVPHIAPYENDWGEMVEADFAMGFREWPEDGQRQFRGVIRAWAPNVAMAATVAEIHWRHILDGIGARWRP